MKMVRKLAVVALFLLAVVAGAQKTYLGMFLAGQKIGYSWSEQRTEKLEGVDRKRIDGGTLLDAGLLGASMKTVIESSTWLDERDRALRMEFKVESAGRTQTTLAVFGDTSIEVAVDNGGAKTKKTISRPTDGPVVDDAVNALLTEPGRTFVYVLDPMTASLVKNTVKRLADQDLVVSGKSVRAQVVEVSEPRATMKVYLSSKGDLLKVDGPMGIEMRPITAAEALGEAPAGQVPLDLAYATALKLDKPVADASGLKSLTIRVIGADLARLPSDAFQTVKREGENWLVTVHPVVGNSKTTVAAAAKQQPDWVLPGLNVPSDSDRFRRLSKTVFGDSKTVLEAAERTRKYVHATMKPNAGIGVLRDAAEVLASREGVCRDYAVLTATILRSGGVPARLVSGLVMMGDSYFYHAWVEVWDGSNWFGVDSTRPDRIVGADHLKLAHGSVEDAFTFTFLDKVKMEVVHVGRT